MIEQSLISQILSGESLDILYTNGITPEMFLSCKKEIEFIINHFEQYNQIPDKVTFLAEFKDFNMLAVEESTEFLVKKLKEAYLYTKMAPILQTTADKVREDSFEAFSYIMQQLNILTGTVSTTGNTGGYDIIANAKDRLTEYKKRCEKKGLIGIPTGIPQLDEITNGWLWGEDLIIITGRTNVGKTWIGEYFATMAWNMGYKVLFYSGEMSREIIGFRFDTLNKHFSNSGLLNGAGILGKKPDTEGGSYLTEDYEQYINQLSQKSGFVVVTPSDFGGRKPTTDDIKGLAIKHNADLIVVDQLSLMSDRRRADNIRVAYTDISEDLFLLSKELGKPIISMAQANRDNVKGKKKADSPELHELAESDGIGQNAARVISLSINEGILKLSLKKNRYGVNNRDVLMVWDINTGYLSPLIDKPEDSEEDDASGDKYGF